MNKTKLLDSIDKQLKNKGLTAAEASEAATGSRHFIANIRRLRYGLPNLENLIKLGKVLDLEFSFGPPRDLGPTIEAEVAGKNFSAITRYDSELATNGGRFNYDAEPVDHLAFSKKWLKANHINPANCILLNIKGHGMKPNIRDGDLVMLDRTRTSILKNRVYAFVDGDNGARIKRLELSKDGTVLLLHSDNPDRNCFPTEIRIKEDMNNITKNIIGQVVWSGHKWT